MGFALRAHPVRGESHIQRNASGEVATVTTSKKKQVLEAYDNSCMQWRI